MFEADSSCRSYVASTPFLYEFYPYRCEVCGATFDSAEVTPPKEVEDFLAESENKKDTYASLTKLGVY